MRDQTQPSASIERHDKTDQGEGALGDLWRWRFSQNPSARIDGAMFSRGDTQALTWIELPSMVLGQRARGAQLFCPQQDRRMDDPELIDHAVQYLRAKGVQLVFAAVEPELVPALAPLGFWALGAVNLRNQHLGLGAVSRRLSKRALAPMVRVAKEARRIRTRLVESPINEHLIERFAQDRPEPAEPLYLQLHKDQPFLKWRYTSKPHDQHFALSYMPKTGLGTEAMLILETGEAKQGRPVLRVVDMWIRRSLKRATTGLLAELAMWSLSEGYDTVQVLGIAGAPSEVALKSAGAVRVSVRRTLVIKRIDESLPAPSPGAKFEFGAGDLHFI